MTHQVQKIGLLNLPVELLTEVVREIVSEIHNDGDSTGEENQILAYLELKSLRLTHAKFANLSYINTFLFARIQLQTTRASLKSLQGTNLSRVADFARILTFVAPPSWMLPRETFGINLKYHLMNDPVDFTEAQKETRYVAYMDAAKDSQMLLDEGTIVQQVWTEVLKTLGPGLRRIRLWSKPCTETDLPAQLPPHFHNHDVQEYACNYASAISGDRLFATAMSCLVASGTTVPELEVSLHTTGRLQCTDIPGWDDLDLSTLHMISLNLRIPAFSWWLQGVDIPGALPCLTSSETGSKASNTVQSFVDKCHTTLLHLELRGEGATGWPIERLTYDFPALQTFDYWIETVKPPLLADAITRMPNLTYLRIGRVKHLAGQGCSYIDWRHVLDAIRDHPNVVGPDPKGLSVSLRRLKCGSRTELLYEGVICQDSNFATERHGAESEGRRASGYVKDEGYILERHFYGEVAFEENYRLRYAFDDWGSGGANDTDEDNAPDEGSEQGIA